MDAPTDTGPLSMNASLIQTVLEVAKSTSKKDQIVYNNSLPASKPAPHKEIQEEAPTIQFKLRQTGITAGSRRSEDTTEQSELSSRFKKMQNRPKNYDIEEDEQMQQDDRILKTQDPELMVEVRLFDRDSLDNTSTVKRNLQPFKFGKIVENNQSSNSNPSKAAANQKVKESIEVATPTAKDNEPEVEEDGKIPLWKRGLMKKKQKEEEEQQKEQAIKEQQENEKWVDVPDWKKSLIKKKEQEK
jgi:hypothetical protein